MPPKSKYQKTRDRVLSIARETNGKCNKYQIQGNYVYDEDVYCFY